jgi:hypothetical protein
MVCLIAGAVCTGVADEVVVESVLDLDCEIVEVENLSDDEKVDDEIRDEIIDEDDERLDEELVLVRVELELDDGFIEVDRVLELDETCVEVERTDEEGEEEKEEELDFDETCVEVEMTDEEGEEEDDDDDVEVERFEELVEITDFVDDDPLPSVPVPFLM